MSESARRGEGGGGRGKGSRGRRRGGEGEEDEETREERERGEEREERERHKRASVALPVGYFSSNYFSGGQHCDETGEAIGVGRLIARPTASLSLEAQQRRELRQKMFGD